MSPFPKETLVNNDPDDPTDNGLIRVMNDFIRSEKTKLSEFTVKEGWPPLVTQVVSGTKLDLKEASYLSLVHPVTLEGIAPLFSNDWFDNNQRTRIFQLWGIEFRFDTEREELRCFLEDSQNEVVVYTGEHLYSIGYPSSNTYFIRTGRFGFSDSLREIIGCLMILEQDQFLKAGEDGIAVIGKQKEGYYTRALALPGSFFAKTGLERPTTDFKERVLFPIDFYGRRKITDPISVTGVVLERYVNNIMY